MCIHHEEQDKNTMPCPYCDFASGQRGMDRCGHCDGTGSIPIVAWLRYERDAWKARAEMAEAQNIALAKALVERGHYVGDIAGVAPEDLWLEWIKWACLKAPLTH